MQKDVKRCIVVGLKTYLLNPAIVALGLVPGYALIETRGRRSWETATHGRRGPRGGRRRVDGRRAGPPRRLPATSKQTRRSRYDCAASGTRGVARVVEDDDPEERLEEFSRIRAALVRRFGTKLVSIRGELTDG